MNDLSNNLSSTAKQFADDTSIFSIVHDIEVSSKQLNDDLKKISDWAYQWKMSFNPDMSKQAQEVIYSRKASRADHSAVTFNNSPVERPPCPKHLGLYLDKKTKFQSPLPKGYISSLQGYWRKMKASLCSS